MRRRRRGHPRPRGGIPARRDPRSSRAARSASSRGRGRCLGTPVARSAASAAVDGFGVEPPARALFVVGDVDEVQKIPSNAASVDLCAFSHKKCPRVKRPASRWVPPSPELSPERVVVSRGARSVTTSHPRRTTATRRATRVREVASHTGVARLPNAAESEPRAPRRV